MERVAAVLTACHAAQGTVARFGFLALPATEGCRWRELGAAEVILVAAVLVELVGASSSCAVHERFRWSCVTSFRFADRGVSGELVSSFAVSRCFLLLAWGAAEGMQFMAV